MPKTRVPAKKTPPTPLRKERAGKEVSAMGWIEDACGRVLMVKQKAGRKLWALPGGKVRLKESLRDALAREIKEETGMKVWLATPCAFYDRHEKGNLTVLSRVSVRDGSPRVLRENEIESVAFRANPPKNSTPSLKYFWSGQRAPLLNKPPG